LTAENVSTAIEQVNPWGVDVASGVEMAPTPGSLPVKDSVKLKAFLTAARRATVLQLAGPDDAAEILALQKLAFASEAEIYQDWDIPPLRQTLPGLQAEFDHLTILKAVRDGRIVGSVRAEMQNGTCLIGRLIVHPECQNQGLGSRLMAEIETRSALARRYEIFTGDRSQRNLYLYEKLGYKRLRTQIVNQRTTLIFMEKEK